MSENLAKARGATRKIKRIIINLLMEEKRAAH